MFLGRDTPGKQRRADRARDWVTARSPAALAAGGLGVVAPIDGIFILPAIAAIACGLIGWIHLKRRPELRGRRLCMVGVIGGVIGLLFAILLHTWNGGERVLDSAESPATEVN